MGLIRLGSLADESPVLRPSMADSPCQIEGGISSSATLHLNAALMIRIRSLMVLRVRPAAIMDCRTVMSDLGPKLAAGIKPNNCRADRSAALMRAMISGKRLRAANRW